MTRKRILLAVCYLALIGCADPAGREPVYPVSGKVLWRGKPAQGASVVLHPLHPKTAEVIRPRGEVGPDGAFTLTTYEANDGAPAGDYRVTIEWWLAGPKEGPPSNRLASHLGQPERSGLTARVDAGPTQLPTFELK